MSVSKLPTGKVRFEGYHIPGLKLGQYKISGSLDLTIEGATNIQDGFPSNELEILISGPRFLFSPKEVYAVFPPRDSLGEFDNVLPHIELEPSTLLWSRKTGADAGKNLPWLALVLLQEEEFVKIIPGGKTTDPHLDIDAHAVIIEKGKWIDLRNSVGMSAEETDEPASDEKPFPPVDILKVKKDFLGKILPVDLDTANTTRNGLADLNMLAHVRIGHDTEDKEIERGVLVCNRLPKSGARAAVHLVSLEERLNADGRFNSLKGVENERVQLLSLHSWEFTCPDTDQFEINDKTLSRMKPKLKKKLLGKLNDELKRDFLYRGKDSFSKVISGFTPSEKKQLLNICHIQTETFKGLIDGLDRKWIHIKEPNKIRKQKELEGAVERLQLAEKKLADAQKMKVTKVELAAAEKSLRIAEEKLEATKRLRNAEESLRIAKEKPTDAKKLKDAKKEWKAAQDALPESKKIDTAALKFFEIGSVPLAHKLREGGTSVSWYRGPLIADKALNTQVEEKLLEKLPIRTADHLLLYNRATQMLDTSYSAAWELGRLITLSHPRISQQIAHWKTSHAREVALAEQNLVFSHIPFTDSDFAHKEDGILSKKLQEYFTSLSVLKEVPFQYLIPNEALLPDESLRFFYIDNLWVECLLDGAFSIGRTTLYDEKREGEDNTGYPHKEDREPKVGVLLRSDLVSGWPSLLIDAYKGKTKAPENEKLKDMTKIEALRVERLGANVMMVIFDGEPDLLTVHLPAESLHFGFIRPHDEVSNYTKELKNLANGKEYKSRTINMTFKPHQIHGESMQIVDLDALWGTMNNKLNNGMKHSGHFAIELIEGVPMLKVVVNP